MRKFNTSAEKVKALDMGAVVAVLVQRDGYSPTKAAELAEEYRKYLALVGPACSQCHRRRWMMPGTPTC